MMLTREQAASTWCPMVRVAASDVDGNVYHSQVAFNRLQQGVNTAMPTSCVCIADQCAMWRWGETEVRSERKIEEVGALRREVTESITVPTRGYCGLAGVPVIAGGAA